MEATDLTASAGISYNKFLAKLASDYRKPNGQFVITFQQATRSRSLTTPVSSQSVLHEISLALVRSVLPTEKGIRLVGVSVSNFERTEIAQLDFAI